MISVNPSTPSVFAFLDAREYLREAYAVEKRKNPAFSQRYIAQMLKASSSSFFRDVLSGKSSLTPARVIRFARLFNLSKAETAYFEDLVAYTQANSAEEKAHALEKLKAAGPSSGHTLLDAFQTEYFHKWHYAALRELLAVHDFRGNAAELGELLNPPIPASEAQAAVDLLLRLKLIRKTAHGGYETTNRVVFSGPQITPAKVRPALIGNLELARRALDAFEPAERPFSYLTVSVSEQSVRQIQEMIRDLQKKIFELVTADENVNRLYQLNFQVFPVSEVITRRKK